VSPVVAEPASPTHTPAAFRGPQSMYTKLRRSLATDGFVPTASKIHRRTRKFLLSSTLFPLRQVYNSFGPSSYRSAYGVLLTANWNDNTFRLCMRGAYGYFYSDYLRTQDTPFVFVDIGSNQGLFSLVAARNPNCKTVIAFEPVKTTYNLLKNNIKINEFSEKIVAYNSAIAEAAGVADIRHSLRHSGAATLSDNKNSWFMKKEKVKTLNANALLDIIPEKQDIIMKIDVEGYEHVVLGEIVKIARKRRIRSLYIEVDEAWHDQARLMADIEKIGLHVREKTRNRRHFDLFAIAQAVGEAA
jgi:FkbM family methyltransferase